MMHRKDLMMDSVRDVITRQIQQLPGKCRAFGHVDIS
jgi:hypothetical protein